MNTPLVRAALLAVTVTATLLPAATASAATLAAPDTVGDVWKSTFDPETGAETVEPAGSQVNVDLVRTVVKHTDRRVVVVLRYADLARSTNRFFVYTQVRTNEGVKRDLGIDATMRWGGDAFLMGPRGEVRCDGLRHSVDYDADVATVSAPRSCLSNPRWVQTRTGAIGVPVDSTGDEVLLDSASDETAAEPTWTARVRRG